MLNKSPSQKIDKTETAEKRETKLKEINEEKVIGEISFAVCNKNLLFIEIVITETKTDAEFSLKTLLTNYFSDIITPSVYYSIYSKNVVNSLSVTDFLNFFTDALKIQNNYERIRSEFREVLNTNKPKTTFSLENPINLLSSKKSFEEEKKIEITFFEENKKIIKKIKIFKEKQEKNPQEKTPREGITQLYTVELKEKKKNPTDKFYIYQENNTNNPRQGVEKQTIETQVGESIGEIKISDSNCKKTTQKQNKKNPGAGDLVVPVSSAILLFLFAIKGLAGNSNGVTSNNEKNSNNKQKNSEDINVENTKDEIKTGFAEKHLSREEEFKTHSDEEVPHIKQAEQEAVENVEVVDNKDKDIEVGS